MRTAPALPPEGLIQRLEARVVVVCGTVLMACSVVVGRFAASPPTVSEQIKADVQARIVERYRERHQN